MSDGYRNGAFALGLTVGGGIVLNLVLWSAYRADKAREAVTQSPEEPQSHPWVEPWDWIVTTFITPNDTLAQWGMALLSLAAVYLLWETLKASRQTLKATREMARETARIGGDQIKASRDAVAAAQVANEVAANQFKLGFKPQLVFHLGGPYVDESVYPLKQILEGEDSRWTHIEVSVEVENIGDHPATITKFFIGTTGGKDISFGGWPQQEAYVRLTPGKRIFLNNSIGHFGDSGISLGRANLAHAGGFHLSAENRDTFLDNLPKVFGWIEYVDQLDVKRRMGFGLEPINRTGRVKTWGADEYNYDREVT
ncbi:hypothetical protein [Pseudooceanicola sp.]|uniref:hypothetical protein n=1 Tax=Pseudooceanicola sp. TaxID=1914328 RepID=UPI0035C76BD4